MKDIFDFNILNVNNISIVLSFYNFPIFKISDSCEYSKNILILFVFEKEIHTPKNPVIKWRINRGIEEPHLKIKLPLLRHFICYVTSEVMKSWDKRFFKPQTMIAVLKIKANESTREMKPRKANNTSFIAFTRLRSGI